MIKSQYKQQPLPPERFLLEVCQGPDCFGSGGGAALLELEECVQEFQSPEGYHYGHNQQFHTEKLADDVANDRQVVSLLGKSTESSRTLQMVRGGCRNNCSMGPNVYLWRDDDSDESSNSSSSSSSRSTDDGEEDDEESDNNEEEESKRRSGRRQQLCHFTKVTGIPECANVVNELAKELSIVNSDNSVTANAPSRNERDELGMAEKMVLRKAERERWQSFRGTARRHQKEKGQEEESEDKAELTKCLDLEQRAVRHHPTLVARAQRRRQRLLDDNGPRSTRSGSSSGSKNNLT